MGQISHLNCCCKSIQEKNLQHLSLRGPSFVCYTLNVCRSAIIFRNLPCPETYSWLGACSSNMVYLFSSPPQDVFFFSVIISMRIIITDFKCLQLFPFCAVSLFKIKSMFIPNKKHKKAEAKSQIYTNKPYFHIFIS